ncbi:ATP-binding protein [Glycomyces sp. L485]|uniref:ATP-binding protein n=1 Tax=Glycomyces sp. L485 TaxID=2909235 RepID=UPI001F4A7357|nr:ATP-binding protein [Glycomyces sp. L485]MCH7232998.1 ATP-binding protein [Glycomyces sp. L485]
MAGFVGRRSELERLGGILDAVEAGGRTGRPGRALLIRGRRRVGKSRLVEEFIDRRETPHLYFTAIGGSREEDLAGFAAELAASTLPGAADLAGFGPPQTWDAALTMLATAIPDDRPSVVVLDEVPYLSGEDPTFEGALQKQFDRTLSKLPVLLILVGSDLATMEQLNSYGRPFHQRGTEMVVGPLTPPDIADMTGLPAAEAIDAYLVTGGLPLILESWPSGAGLWEFLEQSLNDSTSPLLVSAERSMAAEFPTETQARRVLSTIGHGERTFTNIGRAAGDLQPTSLKRSLESLERRGVVVAELPLSIKPSKLTRYRITDPYLRLWLSFIEPGMPLIERGRGSRVADRLRSGWTAWRGRAVEPVIREALGRLDDEWIPEGCNYFGGYWTRTNDPEIDIVGTDRSPVAEKVELVGSIKWHENKPFDDRELARLIVHRSQLPGADEATPMLAVTRSGSTAEGVQAIGPEDLLKAWRPQT